MNNINSPKYRWFRQYATSKLELGDQPAEEYFPRTEGNPSTCNVADDQSMQTACCKYEKASHANRCTWLTFGYVCTWRDK
jgi:hypothetical protein